MKVDLIEGQSIICVPSYSRPDATLLRLLKNIKYPTAIFIREEEYSIYQKWEDYYTLILLKNVTDVLQTRKAIIEWCWENNIYSIWMLDDDINEISFFDEHLFTDEYKEKIDPQCLEYWDAESKRKGYILSNINKKQMLFTAFVDKEWDIWRGQATWLNTKIMKDYNINYHEDMGIEDMGIIVLCSYHNLRIRKVIGIYYDAPEPGIGEGGCNKSEYVNNQHSKETLLKFEIYRKQYLNNNWLRFMQSGNTLAIEIKE